jgi:hypothetical protein
MAEISQFHTIAGAPDLLPAEVRSSVCRFAGIEPRESPTPFGRGVRHAFGVQAESFFTDSQLEQRAIARFGAEAVSDYFEYYTLVGPDRQLSEVGVALPDNTYAERQLHFERETARRLQAWGHTSDRAHRLVLAQEAQDIVQLVNESAADIGVDPTILLQNRDSLTEFMLSLPAKGTVCRLRMTAHEDQQFRWHIGDLNDITALATAAAYCDVVVAEKHWGSILGRQASHIRAQVTSNLLDLPRLLI